MNFAEIKARHEAEDAGFYHDHEIIDGRQNRLLGRSDMPGLLVHQDRAWLIEQLETMPCYFQWFSDSAPDCKQEHGNYVQKYCPACKPKGVDVHAMLGRKAES